MLSSPTPPGPEDWIRLATACIATNSGGAVSPSMMASMSEQRLIGNVTRIFYDVGVQSVDLNLAENCILQAVALFKTMNPTIAGENGRDAYKAIIYAQLRLGQIAAFQGRTAQAFVLLRSLLLDESTLDESNRILRMIAWYDLGMIWFHQDEPKQALGCFRESYASASTDHIVSTIAAASASSTVSNQDLQTQERLLHFTPFIMGHIEYLMSCIGSGSSVHCPFRQQEYIASLIPENDTPTSEPMTLPWSLEILLPLWHSLSDTTGTAAASGEATMMMMVDEEDGSGANATGASPRGAGQDDDQHGTITVQQLLWSLSERGWCAAAA
jgi:hypothetical protein